MKALKTYQPSSSSDVSVTITASPAKTNFTTANLKDIKPTKTYKTLDVSGAKYIMYDAGVGNTFTLDSVFLNRFNFAAFNLQCSNDGFVTTPIDVAVTGLTRDDMYDANNYEMEMDNYMHYWVDIGSTVSYRYVRLYIPAQTPLFEATYFKVGNMLIGESTDLWNPKSGFRVVNVPNINVNEYPSGYFTMYKVGKFYRTFEGDFSKVPLAEYLKLVKSYNAFPLYLDFTSDQNQAYLVKNVKEISKEFFLHTHVNTPIAFREIV